jgi:hypothetical protein
MLAASVATKRGEASEQPIKLMGYVGPTDQADTVRLYSTLRDLSFYIEFPQSAVVHVSEIREGDHPDRPLSLWLKPDTHVRWVREYRSVPELSDSIRMSLRMRAMPRHQMARRQMGGRRSRMR